MDRTPRMRNPAVNTGFEWNISDKQPEISINEANVSVYADMTHWSEEDAKLRSILTVGSAMIMAHVTKTSKKTAPERTMRIG